MAGKKISMKLYGQNLQAKMEVADRKFRMKTLKMSERKLERLISYETVCSTAGLQRLQGCQETVWTEPPGKDGIGKDLDDHTVLFAWRFCPYSFK